MATIHQQTYLLTYLLTSHQHVVPGRWKCCCGFSLASALIEGALL